MRLTTSDGRFAIANFVSTFQIFCRHSSKFTCHPIFSVPDRKNRCRTSDIECRKSESDTCKQPNINEEGKIRYRKSAVGCRKPHTCVRTLRTSPVLRCVRVSRCISQPQSVESRLRFGLFGLARFVKYNFFYWLASEFRHPSEVRHLP